MEKIEESSMMAISVLKLTAAVAMGALSSLDCLFPLQSQLLYQITRSTNVFKSNDGTAGVYDPNVYVLE
jgi:hypothetical protein